MVVLCSVEYVGLLAFSEVSRTNKEERQGL